MTWLFITSLMQVQMKNVTSQPWCGVMCSLSTYYFKVILSHFNELQCQSWKSSKVICNGLLTLKHVGFLVTTTILSNCTETVYHFHSFYFNTMMVVSELCMHSLHLQISVCMKTITFVTVKSTGMLSLIVVWQNSLNWSFLNAFRGFHHSIVFMSVFMKGFPDLWPPIIKCVLMYLCHWVISIKNVHSSSCDKDWDTTKSPRKSWINIILSVLLQKCYKIPITAALYRNAG